MSSIKQKKNKYEFIESVRTILSFWVVLFHQRGFSILFALIQSFKNHKPLEVLLNSKWPSYSTGLSYQVDGFFMISGFFMFYTIFTDPYRKEKSPWAYLGFTLVKRWLRFLPVLISSILLTLTVGDFNSDQWSFIPMVLFLRVQKWHPITFLPIWSLMFDMLFFIISYIVVVLLEWLHRLNNMSLVCVTIVSLIPRVISFFKYAPYYSIFYMSRASDLLGFVPVYLLGDRQKFYFHSRNDLFHLEENPPILNPSSTRLVYLQQEYFKLVQRITPYLIGVVLAYVLRSTQRHHQVSVDKADPDPNVHNLEVKQKQLHLLSKPVPVWQIWLHRLLLVLSVIGVLSPILLVAVAPSSSPTFFYADPVRHSITRLNQSISQYLNPHTGLLGEGLVQNQTMNSSSLVVHPVVSTFMYQPPAGRPSLAFDFMLSVLGRSLFSLSLAYLAYRSMVPEGHSLSIEWLNRLCAQYTPLTWMGQYTFAIYCIHLLVMKEINFYYLTRAFYATHSSSESGFLNIWTPQQDPFHSFLINGLLSYGLALLLAYIIVHYVEKPFVSRVRSFLN